MAEEAPRITAHQVMTRVAAGELFSFVDARQEKAWGSSSSKLPGAVRVPPDQPEGYLGQVPPNRPVVTYCT